MNGCHALVCLYTLILGCLTIKAVGAIVVLKVCGGGAFADGLPDKDSFGQYVGLNWTRECSSGCTVPSGY